MNKTDLVDRVADDADISKKSAAAAIDALVDGVISAVQRGDKVSILGFGTFNPTRRAARMGRNPQTGAPVEIAASKGVRFAPGAAFKGLLNSKGGTVNEAAPAKTASADTAVLAARKK